MFKRALLLLGLVVVGFATQYYHGVERLQLLVQEFLTGEQRRDSSVWLANYEVVIQGKRIPGLAEAEISGLSWDPVTDSLFAVTAKIPSVVQLTLRGDLMRQFALPNVGDTEGIEVISDNRLAVIEERKAKVAVFDIPQSGQEMDTRTLTQLDLSQTHPELLNMGNKGLEGLAWDAERSKFLLAKERGPLALYSAGVHDESMQLKTLHKLDVKQVLARDISSLTRDPRTGNLLLLSDESHLVLEMDAEGNAVSYMSLLRGMNGLQRTIKQAEGITMDAQGRIYIVSEPDLFYVYAPKDCCTG